MTNHSKDCKSVHKEMSKNQDLKDNLEWIERRACFKLSD